MAEPKVRFKQNDGTSFPAWENNTIGHYLQIRDEKQTPSESAPLMAFIAYQGVADKGDRYDRSFLVKSDDKKYKRTEFNDFIYSSNNLDVGSIGLNKYGSAVISVVYEIFKCKENCIPDCINALLQMPQSIAKMLKYRQGALYGQYKIPAEDFLSIRIDMPCLEEQQKIADFLSSVDDVIAASEEEVANLETQKKAVMKKIFLQEVRFKRADGSDFPEWEERRLDEVVEFLDGMRKPIETGDRVAGPYPYYGASGITDYVEGYIFDEDLILLSEDGANILDRNYRVCFMARGKYWVNNHAHVLRANTDCVNEYICEYLESLDYSRMNSGSAQPKLNQQTCRKIPVKKPCLEEQRLIADFLSDFDEAIAAAKKELELWKELKKGLLQQMFV